MALENIPHELRTYPQWIRRDANKRPLNPRTGKPASVVNPSDWGTYDEAVQSPYGSGAGFVFTENDPYTGIDLDVAEGEAATEEQNAIYNEFNSFAERSPSGRGLHIIVKGKVPTGKRRKGIEVYSSGRYFTMTGDVVRNVPIADCTDKLQPLWASIGGGVTTITQQAIDELQSEGDQSIIVRASSAVNGAKFTALYEGRWSEVGYQSQSEADFALVNIIAFYSRNREQIERIFHASALGQRDKAKTRNHLDRMLNKALDGKKFERELPHPDISVFMRSMGEALGFVQPKLHKLSFAAINATEWNYSKLSPQVVVENYLFADVAILIAPGGVGKTTLVIYEAICVALGIELYGRTIRKPGKVVIVSAEDSREQIIARMARIASAMELLPQQIDAIKEGVLIEYVGGEDFRLCSVVGDVVITSPQVDRLIEALRPISPSLVVIDPAVSFGVGEGRVNDAEQGLIRAARRIRDALECCVRLVHHTGKQNSRDGAIDQYAGRGGSAMADGARMVAVLKRMSAEDWHKETGETLTDGADGLLIALPKLSYATAQPHIYLERDGFAYRHVKPAVHSIEDKCAIVDASVIEFLKSEEAKAIFHSKASLEHSETINLSRTAIRGALGRLEAAQRIAITAVAGPGQGKRIRVVEFSPPSMAGTAAAQSQQRSSL